MNTHRNSPHSRLAVAISSLIVITLLLAACGGSSTSGGATPTPGKTATLQTSCPPVGKARAAVMAPLALGKQDTLVYLAGSPASEQQPISNALMRYTVSTRTTTEIVPLPSSQVAGASMSADGQWVIYIGNVGGSGQYKRGIQLVRMDGQGLQTLYCSGDLGFMQLSPDNKYVAFIDVGTPGSDPSKETLKLLNTTTGTIETKPHDSTHPLEGPVSWLDNTHLYVVSGLGLGEGSSKMSLLDITTGTSKQILDLSSPQCLDATQSLDGTQLFTSLATECHQLGSAGTNRGPSNIQVQAATGGPPKTIYRTQTYAITALRFASSTSLLLLIKTDWEPSHNGLWKMNTDGTGLTRLNNEAAIIKDPAHEAMNFTGPFGWTMDQPWANASRDGAYYSMAVIYSGTVNGPNRILVGSMNGGAPVTVASGVNASPVGWTTM
jgi:eukaryotic-like serine/threonine-protein kinase